jgi:dTMP kinase
MTRGLFLSLDGVDGAGKTTQLAWLVEWLRSLGQAVVLCRDPGGTPTGERIRELLLSKPGQPSYDSEMGLLCEAFLYMASRAQLCEQVICSALQRGDTVVSDRFLLANVVYQGHAGGLAPEVLWRLGEVATGGLLPDLTLVLDVPSDVALQRKGGPADRLENRGAEFHARVRAGFLAEARRRPETIKVIDATQPITTVRAAIQEEVRHVLEARARA